MRRSLIAAFLTISVSGAAAEEPSKGACNTFVERELKTTPYRLGSNRKGGDSFVAQEPCTGKPIRIKRCAVIQTRQQKIQRFCFPGRGKPQYAEYFDIVEYWDTPSAR